MKTIVISCMAALALAASDVALAANGGNNGNNGGAGQLHGLAQQLKSRVAECKKAPSAAARKECVEKLVSFLEDVKEKINAVEETIKEKCSGTPTAGQTAGTPVKDRCARAEKLVDRLEKLKARIDRLIAKLEGRDGSATNASAASGSTASSANSNNDPKVAAIESALGSLGP